MQRMKVNEGMAMWTDVFIENLGHFVSDETK